jgi:hypothetical protein
VEADVSDGLRSRARALAAPAGILALGLYLTAPLLGCLDECFVDLGAVHGEKTGEFELADTRLLAWILAWVQHSLTDDPASLYDTNAFHPAARTLVGSEHTLGIALLMLPVRLFTSEAIPIYQLALVLSFLLLGATTFLLVRWLTGSEWASFLAAALAMFMPWRVTELSHIQLLHVQWFPLVWLLVARILAGDARRWEAPLLAVALAFQMLSSFYLSYFLLLSVAVLMGALRVFARPPRRALLRLAAAFAPALLLLTLTSIPYLARESAADLAPEAMPIHSIGIANAWHAIAPALRFEWGTIASAPYSVPLGVCLLAAVTLPFAIRRAADPRGGLEIPLPSRLAALLIPGFSLLRAPFRWGLLIGLAAPVLCGLAIFYLERRFAPSPRTARRVFARITVVVLLAANAGTAPIPVKPAWDPNDRIRAAHEARRGLPPGPLVEIPWPVATLPAQNRESRSLLASARHWQPILNGYTGYPPATYFLLRRTAQRLPERRAIEQLRALADLRFVVVHADLLPAGGNAAWRAAAAAGDVALRRVEGDVRIYEVTLRGEGGAWTEALLSKEPRTTTFAGVPRERVEASGSAGELAASVPGVFGRMLWPRGQHPVQLEITNRTERDWPGFDIQTEGLVQLRYAFLSADGKTALEATAPLDTDIPRNATRASTAYIASPSDAGRYRLRLDLVQRLDGEARPLPIAGIEREIIVTPASRRRR